MVRSKRKEQRDGLIEKETWTRASRYHVPSANMRQVHGSARKIQRSEHTGKMTLDLQHKENRL